MVPMSTAAANDRSVDEGNLSVLLVEDEEAHVEIVCRAFEERSDPISDPVLVSHPPERSSPCRPLWID